MSGKMAAGMSSLARKKLNTRVANLDYLCRRFSIDLSGRELHGALLDCQLLSEVYLELKGGKQISLSLLDENVSEKNQKHIKKNNKTQIPKISISKENIEKHKLFIKNINNSLWNKINY